MVYTIESIHHIAGFFEYLINGKLHERMRGVLGVDATIWCQISNPTDFVAAQSQYIPSATDALMHTYIYFVHILFAKRDVILWKLIFV